MKTFTATALIGVMLSHGVESIRLANDEDQAALQNLRDTFAVADTNNDGMISLDEFPAWYNAAHPGSELTPGSEEAYFNIYDRNGDGFVEDSEVASWMDP